MKTILFISALTLSSAQASANVPKLPKSFCAPGEQIANQLQNCVENQKFIDAAEACLEKLEKTVSQRTNALKAGLDTAKAAQQNKNFTSAATDYATTSATLAYLISLADLAATETVGYLDLVLEPEHTDDPEANGGDPEGYKNAHPCFAETQEALNDIIDDIEHRQAELEEAKDASDMKSGLSSGHSGALDSQAPATTPSLSGQTPGTAPSAKGQKGKDPRASDISGTEDKKKK